MSKPLPKYSQEEINSLFAFILNYICDRDLGDEIDNILSQIESNMYVLDNGKDEN